MTAKHDWTRNLFKHTDQMSLWRLANASRNQPAATVSPLQMEHGEASTPEAQVVCLQAEFFPIAHSTGVPLAQAASPSHPARMPWLPFTDEEVANQISRVAPHTAPGPDGLPWLMLQRLLQTWPSITSPLCRLFNACLAIGHHPAEWKSIITVVLHKPGKPDYQLPRAYRPITVLNTTAKLLEGLMASRITAAAETTNILTAVHYGGCPKRSVDDALMALQQFTWSACRNHSTVAILSAVSCVTADKVSVMLLGSGNLRRTMVNLGGQERVTGIAGFRYDAMAVETGVSNC